MKYRIKPFHLPRLMTLKSQVSRDPLRDPLNDPPRDPKSAVIDAFKNGDEKAFSEIYNRYRKPILKFVLRRTGDKESADDVIQEVFLKIYRFRASYQPQYAFSTWLWAIAKNTMKDLFKKMRSSEFNGGRLKSNTAAGSSRAVDDDAWLTENIPCGAPNAEVLLTRKSELRMLKGWLKKLTRPQRRVVLMRVVYQLPYKEIANRLGLSISAVKCLAYRSRQVLGEIGYVPAFV